MEVVTLLEQSVHGYGAIYAAGYEHGNLHCLMYFCSF
jgi:hypothetical protein